MKYYLAYGPNLNLVQMRQRCPNARVVGYTYLFGARLVFRFDHGFSAALVPVYGGLRGL